MPGQHGQTYDPLQEPAPRGGWFGFVERPYPERMDKAFRVLAAGVAALALIGMSVAIGACRKLDCEPQKGVYRPAFMLCS